MSVASRTKLFRDDFEGDMPHANYDVGRGDSSFVVIAAGEKGKTQTVLVVNWLREFEARLERAR